MNKNEWFQNFRVYIGDDPDYTKNQECPGGPFMRTDDPKSYSTVFLNGSNESMWNYGIEIWCNLEGQYTSIVADLTDLSGQSYEMSICNLGVMGTEYVRVNSVLSSISVEQTESEVFVVD